MAPSKSLSAGNPPTIKSPMKGSYLKNIRDLSNQKEIQPTSMKPMFISEYCPYKNLSRGLLRELCTNIIE